MVRVSSVYKGTTVLTAGGAKRGQSRHLGVISTTCAPPVRRFLVTISIAKALSSITWRQLLLMLLLLLLLLQPYTSHAFNLCITMSGTISAVAVSAAVVTSVVVVA